LPAPASGGPAGGFLKKISYIIPMVKAQALTNLAGPNPTVAASALLTATDLGKTYNFRPVLREVSMNMPPASLTLICGPNGAGKSTLLRLLAGLSQPDTGQINLTTPPESLAFLTPESCAYAGLTASENLTFWAKLHGLDLDRAELKNLLTQAGLAQFAHQPTINFSQGMLQRLNLTRCFAPRPRLALLDEPATGLDSAGLALLKNYLSATRSAGGAIALVSHHMPDFLPEADFVLALNLPCPQDDSEVSASSVTYYGPAAAFSFQDALDPQTRGAGHV
jgi:heme exporter protein A